MGFVFQLHYLLPQLTALENVLVPTIPNSNKILRRTAHDRAVYILDRVGLSESIYQKPSQLSVGECQRISVVRALINQPKLVLADEPTGSLDATNANQLIDLLLDLGKELGYSLVVVTHSIELAGKMDKIYSLSNGKLAIL